MEEYLFIFIPVIVLIVGFKIVGLNILGRNSLKSLPSIFIILVVIIIYSVLVRHINFLDVEYRSYYYTKIQHLEKWNEYIHKICTRRVPVGQDKDGNTIYRTETYDCSYVETHPDRWIAYDNDGDSHYLEEKEFDSIRAIWKNSPMVFVDMNRNYYTIDGDAQEYYWDEYWKTMISFTEECEYENRVSKSQSLFKFRDINELDAKKLGLYDYPKIYNGEQNPILGLNPGKYHIKRFQYLNAYYGKLKQIHIFLLIFPSTVDPDIAEDQKSYWQGGNKNEFVICVGLDKKSMNIKWVDCFSWQRDIILDVECKHYLLSQRMFNLEKLEDWLENNLKSGLWQRREFSEFSYIQSYLTFSQMMELFWIVLGISLIICTININIIKNHDTRTSKRSYY